MYMIDPSDHAKIPAATSSEAPKLFDYTVFHVTLDRLFCVERDGDGGCEYVNEFCASPCFRTVRHYNLSYSIP